jgi:hypothetical protein
MKAGNKTVSRIWYVWPFIPGPDSIVALSRLDIHSMKQHVLASVAILTSRSIDAGHWKIGTVWHCGPMGTGY